MLATPGAAVAYTTNSACDWSSEHFPPPPDLEEAVSWTAPLLSADGVFGAACLPLCTHVAETLLLCLCLFAFVLTMSVVKTSLKLFLLAVVTVLTVLLLRHWMATKQYVFNREDVAKLAKQYAGEFGNEDFEA